MAKRNTVKDIMMTFLTKIVYLGGSFFVSIILARLLGAEGKGIVTALFVIPNILISLADMGVRQAAAYTIGQKKYSLQYVFSSSLTLWIFSSLLSIILLLLYYMLPITTSYHWGLIFTAILLVPIKILDSYYYGIHQGLQQIGVMNMRHLIAFIIRLLVVLLFVWIIPTHVFGAAAAMVVSALGVGIYSYWVLKDKVKFTFYRQTDLPRHLFKQGILFALALFILTINYRIDILLLEQLVTPAEIGQYSVGVGLAELIWQLPNAIGTVLFASSANSKTDEEASKRSARLLRVSLVFLVFGGVLFSLTSQWIVPFIYGTEFIPAAGVINRLLPGILLVVVIQVLHASLSGRGYPLIGAKLFVVAIVVNIVLNLILIPELGINGAAYASTTSYAIGGIGYAWLFARKEQMSMKDVLIVQKEDIQLIKERFNRRFRI
jgi:O-antigen/teichoic acid export membrane protein